MEIESETRVNILNQLSAFATSQHWEARPAGNMMRGLDYYNYSELVSALSIGAQIFKNSHGFMPSLTAPTSFNEHIFARKFLAPMSTPSLADKIGVRDYVKDKVGSAILTPMPWTGDINGLFKDKLPSGRFFLKLNTGCGHNMAINLPDDLTARRDAILAETSLWYVTKYGLNWGEWHYSTIKPKLLLEERIDFGDGLLPDNFKLFCFHGKVQLIMVIAGKTKSMFLPNWEPIDVQYSGAPRKNIPRPQNLAELIHVAEKIAEDLSFARIDLYTNTTDVIRFGEITLTPGNANRRFSQFTFDRWLGQFFKRNS